MISAEHFAKSRPSYWAELLPRLDRFVRVVNLEGGRFSPPIASEISPERHAFVAELAFELLREEIERDGAPSRKQHVAVKARVRKRVAALAGVDEAAIADPSQAEWTEVSKLRGGLRDFLGEREPSKIIVGPKIAGCGIIDPCAADLLLERDPKPFDQFLSKVARASRRLFEVKIVERNFRAVDFRQLIMYAALMSADGNAPRAVGLVNPRRGTFFECTMSELAMDTAGLGGDELLQQIIFDVSAAEISM